MGRKAHKMLQDAMSAFAAEDEAAAKAVIDADDAVDYDFNTIKRMLAAEIAADPGKVDAALDVLMVIKYLERIGDHAVKHRRVGGVPAHGPVSPREDVLSSVFLFFFS